MTEARSTPSRSAPTRSTPHGYVKIHTGKGSRTQTNRYWNLSWYVWNNTGDTATLKDNHGNVLDRCSYSDPRERHSSVSC